MPDLTNLLLKWASFSSEYMVPLVSMQAWWNSHFHFSVISQSDAMITWFQPPQHIVWLFITKFHFPVTFSLNCNSTYSPSSLVNWAVFLSSITGNSVLFLYYHVPAKAKQVGFFYAIITGELLLFCCPYTDIPYMGGSHLFVFVWKKRVISSLSVLFT